MNAWKKLFWIICLLINSQILTAHTIPHDIKRRVTLSLGYKESFNSNEGMKHLPLTTIQGYSWVFDQVAKLATDYWSRGALVATDIMLHAPYLGKEFNSSDSSWFLKEKWWPYLAAYHEFGHARAIRAFSSGDFLGYTIQVDQSRQQKSSVLWYYLYALKHAGLVRDAAAHYNQLNLRGSQALAVYAGGLNNESRLSKEIAEWIYRSNGHIGYFGSYLRGKVSAASYAVKTLSGVVALDSGDIGHILQHYKQYNDQNFQLNQIRYCGMASLLLSSTTYAFIKGYWDFINTGDPIAKTPTWNGLRLPDVNFYLTRNGLSLEVTTAYQINPNLWINLGIETVYYPKFSAMEITPGVRYVLPTNGYGAFDFDCGFVINAFGHLGGQLGIEWTDNVYPLTLHAKIIHHNANTYLGERNITRAKKTDHDTELMISASFNY